MMMLIIHLSALDFFTPNHAQHGRGKLSIIASVHCSGLAMLVALIMLVAHDRNTNAWTDVQRSTVCNDSFQGKLTK